MSLAPPMRLGPYEILALLGSGGMGEVYRARDTRLLRDVAVKVLPATSDKGRLRRFESEARAASLLNHPNILAIYDVGTEGGAPYLVTELLEGETLRDRMAGAPLPARKALDYATQVAEGLAAAHEKGIVHRDLKPENVFVTRDGRLKILDFGLAKLREPSRDPDAAPHDRTQSATEPGAVLGTVGYMAPEQVRGQPADHRSDIFAFGALFYEMLTGSRAFRGDSPVETLNAILKEDPLEGVRPGSLAPSLDHILRRCLEKSPDERFQSARDLAFDLRALPALSQASASFPALYAPRVTRLALRRAGIGLGALLALLAAWALGRGGHVPEPPTLRQMTFRRGTVLAARFAPDGQTVAYSALWDGRPVEIFTTRPGTPEARSLGLPSGDLLALSRGGEIALAKGGFAYFGAGLGTLARASLAGGAPREIAEGVQQADFAPAGSELAIVRSAEGKRRLEYPIGKLLYETTGWLSHPRISPSGDKVAFLDHPLPADDGGSVVVADLRGKRTTLGAGWSSVQGLAWGPGGREVWVSGTESGYARALYALSPSGERRLLMRSPGPLTLMDVAEDGRALVAHSLDRFGIVAKAPGASAERDLSWLDRSISVDLSKDGRTLLFYESGEGGGPRYGVYVRGTDGAPAVRLGEGVATSLSPDAREALAIVYATPPRLVLLPTGPGQPRTLARGALEFYFWAGFFPDGKRILLAAREAGHAPRLYAQDLTGQSLPHPIVPEGISTGFFNPVTPDQTAIAGLDAQRRLALYPLDGGAPRALFPLAPGESPIRWSQDGRALYVYSRLQVPARVDLVDVVTGRRERWKDLVPADPAGVITIASVQIAPDGDAYAYSYGRVLSDLYLVEGLE